MNSPYLPNEFNPAAEFWWLQPNSLDETSIYAIAYQDRCQGTASCPTECELLLGDIGAWWLAHKGINLFRRTEFIHRGSQREGPIVLDIDGSEQLDVETRCMDALEVTTTICTWMTNQLSVSKSDLRVYFSGSKGFHIALSPNAVDSIDIPPSESIATSGKFIDDLRWAASCLFQRDSNRAWNQVTDSLTTIDPDHGEIRLVGSSNRFQTEDGCYEAAVTEIPLDTCESLTWSSIKELSGFRLVFN